LFDTHVIETFKAWLYSWPNNTGYNTGYKIKLCE